jgi:glycosyltransferase involved in cell wall biosynthesis
LGGAENYLKMIAFHYKNEDVEIYAFKNNERGRWNDVGEFANMKFISKAHEVTGIIGFVFIMLFKRKKYDYIYTSIIYANSVVGILKTLGIIRSKYFIARESTSIFLRFKGTQLNFYKNIIRLGYRKMDLLICQTEVMKEQFSKHFKNIEKRTLLRVIPNPIDLKNSKTRSGKQLDLKLPDEFVVTAGRLIELKGYDLLIDSFAKLKSEHPNLKLIILGEGDKLEELQEQATMLNILDSVIFSGFVNNVYPYFKKAKICVVSSRIEGFPNVLLQMMSQNTKVVSSLCAGGIEEIPGIYTCKAGDEETLTTAMRLCLNTNTEKNRQVFDDYLDARSVDAFIETINTTLKDRV